MLWCDVAMLGSGSGVGVLSARAVLGPVLRPTDPATGRSTGRALDWPTSTRRAAAVRSSAVNRYVTAGWAIVPGAWWDDRSGGWRCSDSGCLVRSDLHPDGAPVPSWDLRRWTRVPATVLLATGRGVDVVTLGRGPGMDAARNWVLTRHYGPIAAIGDHLQVLCSTPADRVLQVDAGPDGQLDVLETADRVELPRWVQLHGRGSWAPLPPTRLPGRRGVRWLRHRDPAARPALLDRRHLLDLLVAAHATAERKAWQ